MYVLTVPVIIKISSKILPLPWHLSEIIFLRVIEVMAEITFIMFMMDLRISRNKSGMY